MNFYKKNKLIFFFICRKIHKKLDVYIIRVIDFYGSIQKRIFSKKFIRIPKINNIEYLDMLCYGFKKNVLEDIGLLKKNNNQKIPDHFEPFTGKNAQLSFSILINKYKRNILLFKGDGDQDRPNIIKR